MEDDWDLHAVVRGCATLSSSSSSSSSAVTTTTATVSSSSSSSPGFGFPVFVGSEKVGQVLSLSSDLEPFEARTTTKTTTTTTTSSIEELHELCKPFFSKSNPSSSSSSSFSFSSSSAPNRPVQTTQQKHQHSLQPKHKMVTHAGSLSTAPRSKRRKNQLKKVCHVPAESVSSDIWAWRKYGQKPIKGSPYPRGYYRCSSSKGCLARKQVERNRSDPTMFIVTYAAEHNHPAPTHRNSLAGSTRQKPSTSPAAASASASATSAASDGGNSDKATAKPSSPATSGVEEEEELAPQSAEPESKVEMEDLMEEDDDDDELALSDTVLTDDFFEGLDELTGPPSSSLPPAAAAVPGDCFADPFSAGFALPTWAPNNTAAATATAAAGHY